MSKSTEPLFISNFGASAPVHQPRATQKYANNVTQNKENDGSQLVSQASHRTAKPKGLSVHSNDSVSASQRPKGLQVPSSINSSHSNDVKDKLSIASRPKTSASLQVAEDSSSKANLPSESSANQHRIDSCYKAFILDSKLPSQEWYEYFCKYCKLKPYGFEVLRGFLYKSLSDFKWFQDEYYYKLWELLVSNQSNSSDKYQMLKMIESNGIGTKFSSLYKNLAQLKLELDDIPGAVRILQRGLTQIPHNQELESYLTQLITTVSSKSATPSRNAQSNLQSTFNPTNTANANHLNNQISNQAVYQNNQIPSTPRHGNDSQMEMDAFSKQTPSSSSYSSSYSSLTNIHRTSTPDENNSSALSNLNQANTGNLTNTGISSNSSILNDSNTNGSAAKKRSGLKSLGNKFSGGAKRVASTPVITRSEKMEGISSTNTPSMNHTHDKSPFALPIIEEKENSMQVDQQPIIKPDPQNHAQQTNQIGTTSNGFGYQNHQNVGQAYNSVPVQQNTQKNDSSSQNLISSTQPQQNHVAHAVSFDLNPMIYTRQADEASNTYSSESGSALYSAASFGSRNPSTGPLTSGTSSSGLHLTGGSITSSTISASTTSLHSTNSTAQMTGSHLLSTSSMGLNSQSNVTIPSSGITKQVGSLPDFFSPPQNQTPAQSNSYQQSQQSQQSQQLQQQSQSHLQQRTPEMNNSSPTYNSLQGQQPKQTASHVDSLPNHAQQSMKTVQNSQSSEAQSYQQQNQQQQQNQHYQQQQQIQQQQQQQQQIYQQQQQQLSNQQYQLSNQQQAPFYNVIGSQQSYQGIVQPVQQPQQFSSNSPPISSMNNSMHTPQPYHNPQMMSTPSSSSLPSGIVAGVKPSNAQASPSEDDLISIAHSMSHAAKCLGREVFFVKQLPYINLGVIGKGGTSSVYKVLAANGTIWALKKMTWDDSNESEVASFKEEVTLLKYLQNNPHIIKLLDYELITERRELYLVLEYAEIDLRKYLMTKSSLHNQQQLSANITNGAVPKGSLAHDLDGLRFFWKAMLLAVQILHENRVVHRDLKPANFVMVQGQVKIIDFGIAKKIQDYTVNVKGDDIAGTLLYIAPEALTASSADGGRWKISFPCDVWSLGCILYQMVYGYTPFEHVKGLPAKVAAITGADKSQISFPNLDNPHLMDCLKSCLQRSPASRPTIAQLLTHPFLGGPVRFQEQ